MLFFLYSSSKSKKKISKLKRILLHQNINHLSISSIKLFSRSGATTCVIQKVGKDSQNFCKVSSGPFFSSIQQKIDYFFLEIYFLGTQAVLRPLELELRKAKVTCFKSTLTQLFFCAKKKCLNELTTFLPVTKSISQRFLSDNNCRW